jgi:TonB family protein
MRTAIACLTMLAFSVTAAAQEAPREDGLGPYRFGMSIAEAQATAQGRAWRTEAAPNGLQALNGGPSVAIAGARFNTVLIFHDGELQNIVLMASASTGCEEAVRWLVEELEPAFGAFGSAPGLNEVLPFEVRRTEAGSELRLSRSEDESAGAVYSSRRKEMFVQVVGEPEGAAACRLSISFNSEGERAHDTIDPTIEEIDRAETLARPHWIGRPRSYSRVYPPRALDGRVDGAVTLDCLINTDGSIRCRVVSETPDGLGFGAAALRLAQEFRVMESEEGVAAAGKRVRVPIRFNVN